MGWCGGLVRVERGGESVLRGHGVQVYNILGIGSSTYLILPCMHAML
jgi:hypothetical protein